MTRSLCPTMKRHRTYQELVDVIHDKNIEDHLSGGRGQYALGEAKFTIIAPNSNSYGGNANDYSVAILLEYENRFLVFTGSLEKHQTEMLTNGIDISADVYKWHITEAVQRSTQNF